MGTDTPSSSSKPEVTIVRRRKRRRRSSSGDRTHRVDRLAQAEKLLGILVIVAAVFFRVVFVTHAGGLWRDEVNSVSTAAAPSLGAMWQLTEYESHPVAITVLLRLWMAAGLGGSDGLLRLFGLLSGLALPAAAWFALRRLTRSAALVSLALIAVNPEIVRWSSTVRAWGLGAALAIVAMVLVREASVALTRRRIGFAILAAVLAVQTMYQNVMLIAGIVAAAAAVARVRRRWAEALVPAGIGVVALLSLLPYMSLFERRAVWNALGQQHVTLGDLAGKAWDLANASGPIVVTCGLALVALGLVSAVQWTASPNVQSVNRSRRGVATYAAAAGVLSAVALGLFYRKLSYPTQPWYYVGILAFVVCAEVSVASAVAARLARTALVVLAAIVVLCGAPAAWSALREPQTNLDAVGSHLNAEAAPGDVIAVNPWYLATSLSRYYTGPAALVTIPPMPQHHVHRYDLLKAAMQETDPMAPARLQLQRALESGHRVWLVGRWDLTSGATAGMRLPPPPLAASGWNAAPYESAWGAEMALFLRQHLVEGHEIKLEHTGGRFETASLAVTSGWR